MDNIKFSVKVSGDSGRDYDVSIEVVNSRLFVSCSCPAGLSLTKCKHAKSIVDMDFSRIKDENDVLKLSNLFNSLKIAPNDGELLKKLEDIEKREKELKNLKKDVKKGLDRLFFEGIPIE